LTICQDRFIIPGIYSGGVWAMNFKNTIFFALSLSIFSIGLSATDKKWRCNIPGVQTYAEQGFQFSKKELQSYVQEVATEIYLKGFRNLGDPRDFDHGHMLYSAQASNKPAVFAILYHTQEEAFNFSRKDPGGPFDYVDRQARNWIQWIGSKKIENAKKYELINDDDQEFKKHFTVTEDMLDRNIMGVEILRQYTEQWFFSDLTGKNIPASCGGKDSNLAVVKLPSGEIKVLAFLNDSNYWEYYFLWQKENR